MRGSGSECIYINRFFIAEVATTAEKRPTKLFGEFARKGQRFVQVHRGAFQEPLPAIIRDLELGFSFLDGIFSTEHYVFRSYPLLYDVNSRKYRDIGELVGSSMKAATEEKKHFRSGPYYCVDAFSSDGLLTLLYTVHDDWYHVTISVRDYSIVRTGQLHLPSRDWPLVALLSDHEHMMFIGQDRIRAWLIDL